jgi:hypothetical protein
MLDEKKQDLYFIIYHKLPNYPGEHEYGEIRIIIMTIDAEKNCPRGISDGDYEDLQIHSSYSTVKRDYEESDTRCRPRFWALEYQEVFSVGLQRAEMMVKTLRKAETRMKSYDDLLGEATDFPSFIIRVGRALNVKGFWRKTRDGGTGSYENSDWNICKLTDANWLIGLELDKAREKFIRNGNGG